jgi:site-specific DNA-methyltransferase (adenine-specific)
MGSFPYPRNGILKIDYEFILIFRKPGEPPKVAPELKERARLTTADWNEYFNGHWRFPGARQEEHIAVFPLELPRRLIRMFTFPGEIVLDPFLGSGTTMRAARDLGRSSVGYEIHEEFLEMICRKTGFGEERELFGAEDTFQVAREGPPPGAVPSAKTEEDCKKPLGPPPLGGFGSVIKMGDPREREELHRVREVRDIRTIVLDTGVEHCLAGVLPNARSQDDGVDFLRRLLGRRRVYLRSEEAFDFEKGVYLHLENRTCINARLIRLGLADADPAAGYRLRKRFLRYQLAREAAPPS